jgi:hypothetical protein
MPDTQYVINTDQRRSFVMMALRSLLAILIFQWILEEVWRQPMKYSVWALDDEELAHSTQEHRHPVGGRTRRLGHYSI